MISDLDHVLLFELLTFLFQQIGFLFLKLITEYKEWFLFFE